MAGEWIPQDGDQIQLRFNRTWTELVPMQGDLVELIFGEPPSDCIWVDVPGSQIVIVVPDTTWTDVPGNQVVIRLPNCAGGGGELLDLEPGDFIYGEAVTVRLDESFKIDFEYGTTLEVDLTTYPVARFEADITYGTALEPVLGVDRRFVPNFYYGEALSSSLTTKAPIVMAPQPFRYGEAFTETTFKPEYVGLGSTFYYGESLIGGLTTKLAVYLEASVFHGETLTFELSATSTFDPVFVYGESLISELVVPGLYTEIAATIYYGDTLSASINLGAITVNGFLRHGEALSGTLTTSPSTPFGFVLFHHGDSISATVQTSEAFKLLPLCYGEALTGIVDEVPPDTAYYGESLSAYLSTEDIFRPRPFYHGENLAYGVLTIPPRAIISAAFIDGYGGNTLEEENDLIVMYHANLSAVFRDSFYMNGAIDGYFSNHNEIDFSNSGWNLDLEVPAPGVFNLDIKNGDRATDRYSSEAICLTADLSTRSRFAANIYYGESAYTIDRDVILVDGNISFVDGMSLFSKQLVGDQFIPLCYGNFISDPENVYIDFAGFEVLDCPSNSAFVGETLFVSISSDVGVGTTFYHGQTMVVDALIGGATILRIDFSGSEALTCDLTHETTIVFVYPFVGGERLSAALTVNQKYSNLPGLIEFTEGMTFAQNLSLITSPRTRTVRHLESGCLSNEYVPMTEDGDLDFSLFNPIPIELDPFTHEIKAICE